MTPAILAIANDANTSLSESARKVVNALEAWDFECPTGLTGSDSDTSPLDTTPGVLDSASGCAAFHVALRELNWAITRDENAQGDPDIPAPQFTRVNYAAFYSIVGPPMALTAGDVYWDDIDTPRAWLFRSVRNRVYNHHVYRAGAHNHVADLQSLLARIRLRDQHVVRIYTQGLRIDRIERVLRVDEGTGAACFLGFRDHLQDLVMSVGSTAFWVEGQADDGGLYLPELLEKGLHIPFQLGLVKANHNLAVYHRHRRGPHT